MKRSQLGWIAIGAWGALGVYNLLFQWLAVRLNPKILYDRGVNLEAIKATLPWKVRETLMPIWINSIYVWSVLASFALLATGAWWLSRRHSLDAGKTGKLII